MILELQLRAARTVERPQARDLRVLVLGALGVAALRARPDRRRRACAAREPLRVDALSTESSREEEHGGALYAAVQ